MTPPPAARRDRFATVAMLLLVLALASAVATAILFLKGALGHDGSALCGAEDSDPLGCALDVQANQREQDLVFTLALAGGAGTAVLVAGAGAFALVGRRP